jgi:hypothetical protein
VSTIEVIEKSGSSPIQLGLSLNSGNKTQDFSFLKLNSTIPGTQLIYGCIMITEEVNSGNFHKKIEKN